MKKLSLVFQLGVTSAAFMGLKVPCRLQENDLQNKTTFSPAESNEMISTVIFLI